MRGLPLFVAVALAVAGCAPMPPRVPSEQVGTLAVDGPNAQLNRAPTHDGARVYIGDHVSTGPGTSVKVLLRIGGYVQLDENTDPDFFREAGCLVVQLLTGRIFVEGSGICVRGPDFAARQNSRVQYGRSGTRTRIIVLEGSTTMQRPTRVTLTRYYYYSITAGRVDGTPHRISPKEAEALAAWRFNYFKPRQDRIFRSPPGPPPPGPPPRQPSPRPLPPQPSPLR